jgi:flagellar export protein FliJ
MADPLQTLLRLRRLTVDQARRGLAECLRHQAEADERVREIAASIDRETDTVSQLSADDAMVDNYAAWLRRTRVEQSVAANALCLAETRTQEARAVLTAGRSAVETVETMIQRQAAERAAEAGRQEQKALDEAARSRSAPLR